MDIASYLKRPPVPAALVGIASYLKQQPLLKQLPVPAVLGGALYAGYTGDIPFLGASMDALFTEIDVSIFEVVMYPAIFLFFSGLMAAWLIYLFTSLVVWGRRHRASIESGTPATVQPAEAAPLPPMDSKKKFSPRISKKKYAPSISMPSSS